MIIPVLDSYPGNALVSRQRVSALQALANLLQNAPDTKFGLGAFMLSREALHELVDELPEAALESTQQILESFQTWPPTPPVPVEHLRERVDEMLKTRADRWRARSGKPLSGSSFSLGNFKPDGDGMASMHSTDGPALVTFEIRIFHGYRLEREERLCLSDDEKLLLYSQQINGPDGKENRYEMEFNISEGHLPVNIR